MTALLPGGVEHGSHLRQVVGALQEQGRFSDAGAAADEDGHARGKPAAQDSIELADARGGPVPRLGRHLLEGYGLRWGGGSFQAHPLLLHDGVPAAALGAAAQPARGLVAALPANENALLLHGSSVSARSAEKSFRCIYSMMSRSRQVTSIQMAKSPPAPRNRALSLGRVRPKVDPSSRK